MQEKFTKSFSIEKTEQSENGDYVFSGWAYKYGEDKDGIILKKGGITFADTIDIYLDHNNWGLSIGKVLEKTDSDEGIYVKISLYKESLEQGLLKRNIKEGNLTSLSVGGRMLEKTIDKDGIVTVTKATLNEISIVYAGANAGAKIVEKTLSNTKVDDIRDVEDVFKSIGLSGNLTKKLISVIKSSIRDDIGEEKREALKVQQEEAVIKTIDQIILNKTITK